MLLRPVTSLGHLWSSMRVLGPYAAVALIVPGGTLIAFWLWAMRHRGWATARPRRRRWPGMLVRAFIAVVPLLASCANSGLYNMSDEWCTRHLDASAARCPENQGFADRVADAQTRASTTADR